MSVRDACERNVLIACSIAGQYQGQQRGHNIMQG